MEQENRQDLTQERELVKTYLRPLTERFLLETCKIWW